MKYAIAGIAAILAVIALVAGGVGLSAATIPNGLTEEGWEFVEAVAIDNGIDPDYAYEVAEETATSLTEDRGAMYDLCSVYADYGTDGVIELLVWAGIDPYYDYDLILAATVVAVAESQCSSGLAA